MVKHTLKILQCKHRKIFKVHLAIAQYHFIHGKFNSKLSSILQQTNTGEDWKLLKEKGI